MLNINSIAKPTSLTDALEILAEGSWRIIMGGTDLIPVMRDGRLTGINLLDIGFLKPDLDSIYVDESYLHIGALATHEQVYQSAEVKHYLPALSSACRLCGSQQIRNRGSIGGNIVNASPAADSAPVLVAAGAKVLLMSTGGQREVELAKFAVGPSRTQIQPDELLAEILIPLSGAPWTGKYFKVGDRHALTIAVASVAIIKGENNIYNVACGSVNPTVMRAPAVEALFNATGISSKTDFHSAVEKDAHPIDDVRATKAYRHNVLVNILYNEYLMERGK